VRGIGRPRRIGDQERIEPLFANSICYRTAVD
jgi:hypothetical protein